MAPWSGLWGSRAVLADAGRGDAYRGTPPVVRMENPSSWSIAEIHDDDDDEDDDGYGGGWSRRRQRRRRRGKNAKQITWVLLLKAHHAAGCLAWLASAAVAACRADSDEGLPASVPAPTPPPTPRRSSRFYAFIRALLLSLFLLAASRRLWARCTSPGCGSAPWLQQLADACVALFLIQSLDRVAHSLGCLYIHLLKRVKTVPVSPVAIPPPRRRPRVGRWSPTCPVAARSLVSKQGMHLYFLLFQGVSFLLVGLDLIGET